MDLKRIRPGSYSVANFGNIVARMRHFELMSQSVRIAGVCEKVRLKGTSNLRSPLILTLKLTSFDDYATDPGKPARHERCPAAHGDCVCCSAWRSIGGNIGS